jgi:hypothetical protein
MKYLTYEIVGLCARFIVPPSYKFIVIFVVCKLIRPICCSQKQYTIP